MTRLDTLRCALAGGIYGAGCVALTTVFSVLAVPGFKPFTDLLTQFYGFYGSVSRIGIVVGAFWGASKDLSTSAFSPGSTTYFWEEADSSIASARPGGPHERLRRQH
jgi:hypothetical protein